MKKIVIEIEESSVIKGILNKHNFKPGLEVMFIKERLPNVYNWHLFPDSPRLTPEMINFIYDNVNNILHTEAKCIMDSTIFIIESDYYFPMGVFQIVDQTI